MIGRPCADIVSAAAQHGDVESVDADLEDYLGAGGLRRSSILRKGSEVWRIGLAHEALEGPVAAALDGGRHARQRNDRAELAAATSELECGHVMLHAVVVAGESRRPQQVHSAVGPDEPTTCKCRPGNHGQSHEGAKKGKRGAPESTRSCRRAGKVLPIEGVSSIGRLTRLGRRALRLTDHRFGSVDPPTYTRPPPWPTT